MKHEIQYLQLLLISLAVSVAWHAYHSLASDLMLDQLLLIATWSYPAAVLFRWWRQRAAPGDTPRPFHPLGWANTILFFGLVATALLITTARYQYSFGHYAWHATKIVSAWAFIAACAWMLGRARPRWAFHLPMALGSLLLGYEIYLTTTTPRPERPVVFAPLMAEPFICFNGGNGRLINDHLGLPQRQYLSAFVPGDANFRPAGASHIAARNAAVMGTVVLTPVAGTVISIADHLPDLGPYENDPSHPPGNHLCIQFGDDRFLYLANLMQDSVLPGVGDTVAVGEPIARIGKNGSHTEAALVVLVVDDPNVIKPNTRSLPFFFRNVARTPDAPAEPQHFPRRNQILWPRLN